MAAAARTSGTSAPDASVLYRGCCASSHWVCLARARASRERRMLAMRVRVARLRAFDTLGRAFCAIPFRAEAVFVRVRDAASASATHPPRLISAAARTAIQLVVRVGTVSSL